MSFLCGCWAMNSGPPAGEIVLFTAQPSLLLQHLAFLKFSGLNSGSRAYKASVFTAEPSPLTPLAPSKRTVPIAVFLDSCFDIPVFV